MRYRPFFCIALLPLLLSQVFPCAIADGAASLRTDRSHYGYVGLDGLQHVEITFRNDGTSPVFLPTPNPFIVRDADRIVYEPGGAFIEIRVDPGAEHVAIWDFSTTCRQAVLDNLRCAGLALPDTYVIEWTYGLDADFEHVHVLTAAVTVTASVEP